MSVVKVNRKHLLNFLFPLLSPLRADLEGCEYLTGLLRYPDSLAVCVNVKTYRGYDIGKPVRLIRATFGMKLSASYLESTLL